MVLYNPVKRLSLTFLLTISTLSWTSYAQLANTTQPEVTILQGMLRGITIRINEQRNALGFLAIPYAQPPIGKLRFANPVAADPWTGIRDASIDAQMCPQRSGNVVVGDEDCLYLNVYTPQIPESTNSSLLPVMVYIYGGAFVSGNGKSSKYGPQYLLVKDVVLVVPNYRLGSLGFLSTGDEVASGNWALKDQVLALKWVQNNIKFFGGDPDQVTIFGISAGSACLDLLTLSPSTIGLFHRYIAQSGSALGTWVHQPRAFYKSRAFELGKFVGCANDTSASLIDCLRTVDIADMIISHSEFYLWESHPSIIWSPTDEPDIEGAVLTDSPTNLFAAGKIHDLPSISGIVRDEGLLHTAVWYRDEKKFYDLLDKFDIILPEILNLQYQSDYGAAWVKAMKSYYFNNDLTTDTAVLLSNFTVLISDALFIYPAYNALQQKVLTKESQQYFYTFNYGSNSFDNSSIMNYGIAHGADSRYFFPSATGSKNMSQSDLKMVDIMVELWTSFAINGIPTCSAFNDTTTWEPHSAKDNYLRIGNESDITLEAQYSFMSERMRFWDNLNIILQEPKPVLGGSNAIAVNLNLLIVLLLAYLQLVDRLVVIY